jgi:citronellyl-CoA dehydrogenase
MATPSLARYGSPELKARYLAPALHGQQVAAVAVTEPDAGSDVSAIQTRAIQDGDEWVINGSKLYITNGAQADWLCLLVRTGDDAATAACRESFHDTPGFTVSRTLLKLGNHSSDHG